MDQRWLYTAVSHKRQGFFFDARVLFDLLKIGILCIQESLKNRLQIQFTGDHGILDSPGGICHLFVSCFNYPADLFEQSGGRQLIDNKLRYPDQ